MELEAEQETEWTLMLLEPWGDWQGGELPLSLRSLESGGRLQGRSVLGGAAFSGSFDMRTVTANA